MYDQDSNSYKGGIPKQYHYLKEHDFKEWEIPPWDVIIDRNKCIGEGGFGKAYIANWRGTQIVAKVSNQSLSEDDKTQLIQEFEQMTKLHHPNVVQLLGYVKEPFIILIEYLSNGNLEQYISKSKLSNHKKIIICNDILKAIAYMHNRKPQYLIHRDIKRTNILVNTYGKVKITDFGLSRMLYEKNIENKSQSNLTLDNSDLTQNVGTYRYMAPELILGNSYKEKIDIWSCGIVFFELFEETKFFIQDWVIYVNSIQNKSFKIPFKKTPKNIQLIISNYMLQIEPNKRMSAKELIFQFQEVSEIQPKCFC